MQYRWVFLHVVCILTHPMGLSKYAQLVKILSNTTHQKKLSHKIYLLYGKIVSRWMRAFWLDPTQSEFCNTNRFYGNGHTLCIFGHKSWQIQNKQVWSECHIINFLLILLAQGTLRKIILALCFLCYSTVTISGQYSLVWPTYSVNKKLVFLLICILLVCILTAFIGTT